MSISHVDLITDALRLINVTAETEAATAEQAALGLRVLNEMMADWESDGIDVGFIPAESLTDDLPVMDGVVQVIKYNLAHALAPYFSRATPPDVLARAINGYNRLQRESVKDRMVPADMSHLHRGESEAWYDVD